MPTRIEIVAKLYNYVDEAADETDISKAVRSLIDAVENNTDLQVWSLKANRVQTVKFTIHKDRPTYADSGQEEA